MGARLIFDRLERLLLLFHHQPSASGEPKPISCLAEAPRPHVSRFLPSTRPSPPSSSGAGFLLVSVVDLSSTHSRMPSDQRAVACFSPPPTPGFSEFCQNSSSKSVFQCPMKSANGSFTFTHPPDMRSFAKSLCPQKAQRRSCNPDLLVVMDRPPECSYSIASGFLLCLANPFARVTIPRNNQLLSLTKKCHNLRQKKCGSQPSRPQCEGQHDYHKELEMPVDLQLTAQPRSQHKRFPMHVRRADFDFFQRATSHPPSACSQRIFKASTAHATHTSHKSPVFDLPF